MIDINTAEYKAAAARAREMTAAMQKEFRSRLSAVSKPLGELIIREGANPMPARGGLQGLLRSRGTVRTLASGSSVSLYLGNSKAQLRPINDKGRLRHPVFERHRSTLAAAKGDAKAANPALKGISLRKAANKSRRKGWVWVSQHVPGRTYDEAFVAHKDEVAAQIVAVANEALKGIGS